MSALIFILTLVAAVVGYIYVFKHFTTIWFDFTPIFFLCVITFLLGAGVFTSAVMLEKKK